MNLILAFLRILFFFSLFILSGCSGSTKEPNNSEDLKHENDKVVKTTKVTRDTLTTLGKVDSTQDNIDDIEEDSDCVFNDDYKGLTTEWLKELGIQDYIWIDSLNKAVIPKQDDTIYIGKGGCYHFGFDVKVKIFNDKHNLSDSAYWIDQALKLATEYGMTEYVKIINNGKFWVSNRHNKELWFEVEDDDFEDNLYYSGIGIIQENDYWWVKISKYYN